MQLFRLFGDIFIRGGEESKKKIGDVDNKTAALGKTLGKAGDSMIRFGKQWSMYVSAPLIGFGTIAFNASMGFEESMSKVIGLVGVAADQVAEWEQDLLRMAPALGKAPRELADALFFVTSAGIRGAEALEVLEAAGKASASGLGETKIIADLVTSAMNAYGIENLSAAHATDILVAAVREGKAEAPEMAASLGTVLPIAAEMGVSFDQVAAATAAMTRTGTDAATASTQLRAIMAGLLKPSQGAEEALEKMGTSSAELRKQIREEGLLSALENLRDMTNEYGEDAVANVFPNIRALIGMLDLMGENAEENAKIFNELTNATGSLEHAFETAEQTTRQKWNKQLAAMQVMLIKAGDAIVDVVLPSIESLTEWLKNATEWFDKLDDNSKKTAIVFGIVVAAIGPLVIYIGLLVKAVGAISTAVGGLGVKLGILAGPAGWIALAVAAIAGIGWAFWRASRESQKAIRDLDVEATARFASMGEQIEQTVAKKVLAIADKYKNLRDNGITYFQEMFIRQIEITEENWDHILGRATQHKNDYLNIIENQRDNELNLVRQALQQGIIEDEESAGKLFEQIEANFVTRQGVVESGFAGIEAILKKAYDEQRELTEDELGKLKNIKEEVYKELLEDLQKYTADWIKIETIAYRDLEKLDKEELQKRQDLIDSVYEDEFAKLDSHTEEQLNLLAEMHAAGLLSEKDYRNEMKEVLESAEEDYKKLAETQEDITKDIIEQTERLKTESIKNMYEMQKEIVEEFQMMGNSLVWHSIVPDMIGGILTEFSKLGSLASSVKTWGSDIIDGLWTGMQSIWGNVKTWFDNNVLSTINRLNPFARSSPSLVDNVWAGVREIERAYRSLTIPEIMPPQLPLGQQVDNRDYSSTFSPTFISPKPLSPAEQRREFEKYNRQLAMEGVL